MAAKIKILVAADMLFLLLLALSGSSTGIISEVFYILAFLAPVGMMLSYIYKPQSNSREAEVKARGDMLSDLKRDFSLTKSTLKLTLPLIFPSILITLLTSLLTSFVLEALGGQNALDVGTSFGKALITYAVVPAILEELLFRLAPVKLLKENKRTALLLSAVMFAFAHANLFQIPYALLAGFIFSALYLVTGSILPSMTIHFLNNLISLLSIFGFGDTLIIILLSSLAALSIPLIILMRRSYKAALKQTFSGEKAVFSYYPLFFIITSLILAISALFA